jgi:hypothetical protein
MKTIIIVTLAIISLIGCGTPGTNHSSVHERTIGAVQITYDDNGSWIKISSYGTAALHNNSVHATSEAAKVAAMHAKQNIADFVSDNIQSDKTVDIESTSSVRSGRDKDKSEGEINTVTTVIEHIKDNSSAILRGVQVTSQTVTKEFVKVEVAATKQSINAAQSIQSSMNSADQ